MLCCGSHSHPPQSRPTFLLGSFGELLSFQIQSAFLKFTTTEEVVLAGEGLFKNAKASYNGADVFVAINAKDNATLSYKVGSLAGKSVKMNFESGKIYNLGTLAKAENDIRVMGNFNDATDWGTGYQMYATVNSDYVARDITLTKDGEFKIKKGDTWSKFTGDACNNTGVGIANDNMVSNCAGTYDIFMNGYYTKMYMIPHTISLIGDGIEECGDWSNDYVLTFDEVNRCWTATVTLVKDKGFKIRAFKGWDLSWGIGTTTVAGDNKLYHNGDNCVAHESGKYELKFYWDFDNLILTKK